MYTENHSYMDEDEMMERIQQYSEILKEKNIVSGDEEINQIMQNSEDQVTYALKELELTKLVVYEKYSPN
jgi:Mn-dependent DtxR family transcriptional regulator